MRLARLEHMLQAYVERGEIPGAVALIQRGSDEPHYVRVGYANDARTMEINRKSLIRLGSMTKPIVSVAALMLFEEGLLRLTDPITRWLPEFGAMTVLPEPQARLDNAVPATRSITVLDLLTHRPGFGTALVAQGELGQALQPLSGGLGQRSDMTPSEWIARLAGLPLAAEPGSMVINGFATDVLGEMISRITGLPLPELLSSRLFKPLGMHDTSFHVPANKIDRLVPAYTVGWLSGKRTVTDPAGSESRFAREPRFPSGSGGLVSTADDYLRFGQMLLAGGLAEGQAILSRKTVEFMTTNFLTVDQRAMPFFGADFWADRGLGLGVYILDSLAGHHCPASVGQYGWGGAFATTWFNDPIENIVAILVTQVAFAAVTPAIRADFEAMVYQAITD